MNKLRVAKRPFNIHAVLRRIRLEVKQFADAAMFDLAAQGYASPFHQLVHRVTNRWGYVGTAMPEATRRELEQKLPSRYRVEINRLLVPFGKHVCTGRLPKCSVCPVLEYCQQVGVTEHR
ncbi:MAG TPA: hypothetical protein VFH13_04825 [Gemmatimonadaceae bacterium]|nr:hypothetical protein [Gemmatimonadaceae bacterium]